MPPACFRLLPTPATGLKRRAKKIGENPLPSESFWGKSAASQRCLGIAERGCSSGVEHNLAKVGVEGSNPFARSNFQAFGYGSAKTAFGRFFVFGA